jgi:hypothetical protein
MTQITRPQMAQKPQMTQMAQMAQMTQMGPQPQMAQMARQPVRLWEHRQPAAWGPRAPVGSPSQLTAPLSIPPRR